MRRIAGGSSNAAGGGGSPTGAAGGSLGGSYPNPTVAQIDGTAGSAAVIAGTSLVAAAGAGGIDFSLGAGAWKMPTGAGSWAGASGEALSLVATAAAITITAAAASTWSTSVGALTIDSAAALNLGTVNATSVVLGNATNTAVINLNVELTGGVVIGNGSATPVLTLTTSSAGLGLFWSSTNSNVQIESTAPATDLGPGIMTLSGQSALATASVNTTGGNVVVAAGLGATSNATFASGSVVLRVQTPNTGGTEAYVVIQRNTTSLLQLGALVGSTSSSAIYSNVTASATNYILQTNGTSTNFNAPGAGTVSLSVTGSNQATFSSTLAGFKQPVGGLAAGNAFAWTNESVALTTSASNVLSATQYAAPRLKFTGTLTGAGTTVTFPATEGAFWICDFDGVTFSANTIALIANGNTWGTTISALTTVVLVYYIASEGKLYGASLTS